MTSKTSLDKSKIKFLLLEGIHPGALQLLHQAGYHNVESISGALSPEALLEKMADVHFVGIRSRTQLTEAVFQAAAVDRQYPVADIGSATAPSGFSSLSSRPPGRMRDLPRSRR